MSALILKLIACVTMLLDHLGYYSNDMLLRGIGRIAFPIFLYLIYNGYKHTSSPAKYALRLALFALVSQIPYDLFCYNRIGFVSGNVFFTLLAALLCIWAADKLMSHKVLRWVSFLPAAVLFFLYYLGYLKSDYGVKAIAMTMVFYYLDGKAPWKRILVCLGFLCALYISPILSTALGIVRGQGFVMPRLSSWEKHQIYSVLALPLLFLYNGKKGALPGGKWVSRLTQWGFYLFYPLHLLVLWAIHYF